MGDMVWLWAPKVFRGLESLCYVVVSLQIISFDYMPSASSRFYDVLEDGCGSDE